MAAKLNAAARAGVQKMRAEARAALARVEKEAEPAPKRAKVESARNLTMRLGDQTGEEAIFKVRHVCNHQLAGYYSWVSGCDDAPGTVLYCARPSRLSCP